MREITYTVAGMSCGHCERTVSAELEKIEGVEAVGVEPERKRVVVRGNRLDDAMLRAAIEQAGYRAA